MCYNISAKILWDEPKRLANLAKHEMDFADLDIWFFEAARIGEAGRGRFKALGHLRRRAISVVFATRGNEAVSVVSMRPASAKERRLI